MAILPNDRFLKCSFYTPIGTTNVQLVGNEIEGDWKQTAKRFYGERDILLAQRFVNCPDELARILDFTKRWGPLLGNPYDGREGFRFSIAGWIGSQEEMRKTWRIFQRGGSGPLMPAEPIAVEIAAKRIELWCPDLWTFMMLEIQSKAERLRQCDREGCVHPYFVPQHGKERYCSTDCANWAQGIWKKRWHEEQRQRRRS